jgi:hypothetical protein
MASISRDFFIKMLAEGKGPPLVVFDYRVGVRPDDAFEWIAKYFALGSIITLRP